MNKTATLSLVSQKVHGLTLSWLENDVQTGSLLLFLHGFPDTARVWELILAELAEFQVMAPFVHGVISADKVPSARYGLQAWCLDLLALLALKDPDKKRPIFIIAHDLAGPYAQRLAEYLGRRCQGLVFINSLSLEQLLSRLDNPKQWLKSYYIFLFQLRGGPEFLLKLFHPLSLKQIYDLGGVSSDDPLRQESRHVFAGIEQYRQIFQSAPLALFQPPLKLSLPTLFLWGEQDPFLEIPTQKEVSRLYQNPTIRVLDGSHWILRSHAPLIARYLRQFIVASQEG